MDILQAKISYLHAKFRSMERVPLYPHLRSNFLQFIKQIKMIGYPEQMNDFERRKLGIFNLLNFFQLLTGFLIPMLGLMHNDTLPVGAWLLACLPCTISASVLVFNYYRKYQAAQLTYFILYPFFTGFVYLHGMNSGGGTSLYSIWRTGRILFTGHGLYDLYHSPDHDQLFRPFCIAQRFYL